MGGVRGWEDGCVVGRGGDGGGGAEVGGYRGAMAGGRGRGTGRGKNWRGAGGAGRGERKGRTEGGGGRGSPPPLPGGVRWLGRVESMGAVRTNRSGWEGRVERSKRPHAWCVLVRQGRGGGDCEGMWKTFAKSPPELP